jgi:hypothetical protein
MAVCKSLVSINKDKCLNNIGGLKLTAYVFPSEDRILESRDEDLGIMTSLEYNDGSYPVLPITISYHKNTANFKEGLAGVIETSNQTNTMTLSITVNNRSYDKSRSISILSAGGREVDIIISQNNGTNWYLPEMIMINVDSDTGTVRTDGSNYVLTFTNDISDLVYGIEDADLADLISTGTFS